MLFSARVDGIGPSSSSAEFFAYNSPIPTTGISLVKDVAEAELFGTIRVSMRSLQRAVGPARRIGACEPHQHTFSVPFAFAIAKARSSHFTSGSLAFQVML